MKKHILLYALPIIQILTISCKNDLDATVADASTDTTHVVDKDLEKKIKLQNAKNKKTIFFPDSLHSDTYIHNILALEKEIDSLLSTKSDLDANLLYDEYSQKLIENLTSFNFTKSEMLDQYVSYPPDEIPANWKEQIEQLKNQNIVLVYEGEGYYSFHFKHDYFYEMFKGKVTPDLEAFLANMAEDSKVVFQVDAGIVVPWMDIRKRVTRWENFVIKYPESHYNASAKEIYAFYLSCYLLGMENTRTYEIQTKEIYPEIKAEFIAYINTNSNSFSIEITKEFLAYFEYEAKNTEKEPFEKNIQTHVNGILQETLNYNTN